MLAFFVSLLTLLLIGAIIFESRLLSYLLQQVWLIKLTAYTRKLILFANFSILALILNGFRTDDDISSSQLLIILSLNILWTIIRFGIFYGTKKDDFRTLSEILPEYEVFVTADPEMCVVFFPRNNDNQSKSTHVIPVRYLINRDLILGIENNGHNANKHYSLTFCLLCNSAHAFKLPEIYGREIEISSHRGMIKNGNKILADANVNYMWQQLTGKPLIKGLEPLEELIVARILWDQVFEEFPDAKFYSMRVNPLSYFVFNLVRKLVNRISFFKFTASRGDDRLEDKALVIGLSTLEGSKAYPLSIFGESENILIPDVVAKVELTLISSKHGIFAFRDQGYLLEEEFIVKGERRWDYMGRAADGGSDLQMLPITSNVYWYMWVKMFPDSEIYL